MAPWSIALAAARTPSSQGCLHLLAGDYKIIINVRNVTSGCIVLVFPVICLPVEVLLTIVVLLHFTENIELAEQEIY